MLVKRVVKRKREKKGNLLCVSTPKEDRSQRHIEC